MAGGVAIGLSGVSGSRFTELGYVAFIMAVILHLCDYLIPACLFHGSVSSRAQALGLFLLTSVPPALAEGLPHNRWSVHIQEVQGRLRARF